MWTSLKFGPDPNRDTPEQDIPGTKKFIAHNICTFFGLKTIIIINLNIYFIP